MKFEVANSKVKPLSASSESDGKFVQQKANIIHKITERKSIEEHLVILREAKVGIGAQRRSGRGGTVDGLIRKQNSNH